MHAYISGATNEFAKPKQYPRVWEKEANGKMGKICRIAFGLTVHQVGVGPGDWKTLSCGIMTFVVL